MIRQVHAHPKEVTIFGDVPLTNIALAVSIDPQSTLPSSGEVRAFNMEGYWANVYKPQATFLHPFSMKAFYIGFALMALQGLAAAQHFDFGWGLGVKGGVPTTDLLNANRGSTAALHQQDNYLIGPVGEIRIPFGFAVEVDGLYRGTNYRVTNAPTGITSIDSSSWEIPYLAKFRFPIPLLKPFIGGGGAYRTFNDLPPGVTPSHNAFVAAGGLELRISRVRLSAEGRYLRWGSTPFNDFARLKRDQAEILFGFIFSNPR